MMQLVWLLSASRAREAAIDYIAEDNPTAALDQLDAIERQTGLLTAHPHLGRPGRMKGTRELVIVGTPFILVYRIRRKIGCIELFRFLHGAQQWPQA